MILSLKFFATEKYRYILIAFLNDIVKPLVKITSITFIPTVQITGETFGKTTINDVACRDDQNGKIYIVEMQQRRTEDFIDRMESYCTRAVALQCKVGDKLIQLNDVTLVAITNFKAFPEEIRWSYLNPQVMPEKTLRAVSYVFLDLSLFNLSINELQLPEDRWCYFFKQIERPNIVDMIKATGGTRALKDCYSRLNLDNLDDDDWQKYIQWSEKKLHDEKIQKYHEEIGEERGEKKGMAEGLKLGEKKGKAEGFELGEANGVTLALEKVAITLINEGALDERIAMLTGLSVDSILQIRESMKQKMILEKQIMPLEKRKRSPENQEDLPE